MISPQHENMLLGNIITTQSFITTTIDNIFVKYFYKALIEYWKSPGLQVYTSGSSRSEANLTTPNCVHHIFIYI